MKQNYIEINFTKYVLEYGDRELPDEREMLIRELSKEGAIPVGIEFHPQSMREVNAALHVIYPEKEMEIDWRDPTTVWIWPRGVMEQFTFTEEEKKRHFLQRTKMKFKK